MELLPAKFTISTFMGEKSETKITEEQDDPLVCGKDSGDHNN